MGLGFGVQGTGARFWVWGLGFRVLGLQGPFKGGVIEGYLDIYVYTWGLGIKVEGVQNALGQLLGP